MTGKILLIDPIPTNRIVMRVKLQNACYDVDQCETLDEALERFDRTRPNVVIASDATPATNVADMCRALRQCMGLRAIPLIIIATHDTLTTRLDALDAGADDVLDRPVVETLLMARMRGLLRDYNAASELRLRDETRSALGFAETGQDFETPPRIQIVARHAITAADIGKKIEKGLNAKVTISRPEQALMPTALATPDVFVLCDGASQRSTDLQLLTEWRARAPSQRSGVVVLSDDYSPTRAARALDLGANDLMPVDVSTEELVLRLRRQVDRKRTNDLLRRHLRAGVQAALTDPLTGLHNRRYALAHLKRTHDIARTEGRQFAVMVADIDHFKMINDTYGHATGDEVLCAISRRLQTSLRSMDMLARVGGEEFLVVFPDTTHIEALVAARRLCAEINASPVRLKIAGQATDVFVTISIGATIVGPESPDFGQDAVARIMDTADGALYDAKLDGRNQALFRKVAA